MSVENIAETLMQRFKEIDADIDHTIDQRWLELYFIPKLNSKEIGLVNDAIKLLVDRNYIKVENRSGMFCLILEKAGFDLIYKHDKNEIIANIQKDILDKFAMNKSKVGHTLDYRWIELSYMQNLNRIKRKYVSEALLGLDESGYIKIENRGVMKMLVLTIKGFNRIYS